MYNVYTIDKHSSRKEGRVIKAVGKSAKLQKVYLNTWSTTQNVNLIVEISGDRYSEKHV